MYLQIDNNVVITREAEDLERLAVQLLCSEAKGHAALVRHGIGSIRDGHAFLSKDRLFELASCNQPPGWSERFDRMIARASKHGWINEEGLVRAHLEHVARPIVELASAGEIRSSVIAGGRANVPESTTLRAVLGNFGSGVVVVAAQTDAGPVGMTCQSFASLSLEPPLITFCPSLASTTWPRIRPARQFCVNILSAQQEHLSEAFARSGADKFLGVDWTPGPNGTPILAGVLAWVECGLWNEYDGGDHTIVVGRVLEVGAAAQAEPLLFLRGAYVGVRAMQQRTSGARS